MLARDARSSVAAIELVLAQPAISSQLIDNLNASMHLRALLADLFLITEILELRQSQAEGNGSELMRASRSSLIGVPDVFATGSGSFRASAQRGTVADADATVRIENPACGDVLQITLKLSGDRIEEIRFLAKGCVVLDGVRFRGDGLVEGKTD